MTTWITITGGSEASFSEWIWAQTHWTGTWWEFFGDMVSALDTPRTGFGVSKQKSKIRSDQWEGSKSNRSPSFWKHPPFSHKMIKFLWMYRHITLETSSWTLDFQPGVAFHVGWLVGTALSSVELLKLSLQPQTLQTDPMNSTFPFIRRWS